MTSTRRSSSRRAVQEDERAQADEALSDDADHIIRRSDDDAIVKSPSEFWIYSGNESGYGASGARQRLRSTAATRSSSGTKAAARAQRDTARGAQAESNANSAS